MAKIKIVVGVACALVGACGGGRSGWTVTSQPDPMTDVRITKASTRFSGEQFDAEVEIACNSKGGIHYSFTTFDKSGNPAEITSKPVFGREALVFAVRQDDRAAKPMWTSNPRYSNLITFSSKGGTDCLAGGSQLTVRIPLVNGVETFVLDQTDKSLREMLEPCLAMQRDLNAQKEQEREAKRQAAEEAAAREYAWQHDVPPAAEAEPPVPQQSESQPNPDVANDTANGMD